jgi:nucleoside-diphosphate-sugar epimerase
MTAGSANRDFASMLDELLADDGTRRAWSGLLGANLDYLNVMDALHSGRIVISDDTAAQTYREVAQEAAAAKPSPAPPPPQRPAPAPKPKAAEPPRPSVDPAAIARELGLGGRKSAIELDTLRRRFAFANHPDRVEPALRAVAMTRMQVANMLIDEAKRRGRR